MHLTNPMGFEQMDMRQLPRVLLENLEDTKTGLRWSAHLPRASLQ